MSAPRLVIEARESMRLIWEGGIPDGDAIVEAVATVWGRQRAPDAYADLFAESPTLLALLKECLANSPGRTSDWRRRVEESIARAEGKR